MAIEIGKRAPAFSLRNQDGEKRALKGYAGSGLILYFYPKAFTPGCTGESCDFRDSDAPLRAAGFTIVGISPDPVEKLAQFKAEYHLPFDLLSDPDHTVSEKYGAWGTKKNYGREYEGLIRSTVVVDAAGKVERLYANVRAKGHVARLRRELLGEK
ncbi:MAG: peroxiredoxin Q/BCP [Chloroflexi bacterium]|jgi:peroxiredoxin Q/BCP|nr:MAG: peroxiredoxin Q/BCP [Chloroflexota bacterium]